MRKRKGRVNRWLKLAMLLCFVAGFTAFVCFAILTERRRVETLAAIPTPPEVDFHARLVETLEKDAPEPPPDLQPALDTIQQWRNLFQRKEETVDGEEWDAVLDLWYDADGWDDLTAADMERIGAFLEEHEDFIEALRRVAAAGGPVEAIQPLVRQRDKEHVKAVRDSARLLRLNAIYHARAGETETAVLDCVAGFQLAEALVTEPDWLALGTRKTCVSMVFHTLFDAFPPGTLSAGETAQLIYQAQAMAGREALVLRLQSHQRDRRHGFDELLDEGWTGRFVQTWNLFRIVDDSLTTRAIAVGYASPLGRPWLNRDISQTLEIYQHAVEVAHLPYYEAMARIDININGFSPYARIMDSTPISVMRSQARLEVQLQLLQIGLTLEQHQAEAGALPNTLDALSAEFAEATLTDPFTGDRFIYRQDGEGFLLYSAGPNQTDDGGRHDFGGGDIVWRHD